MKRARAAAVGHGSLLLGDRAQVELGEDAADVVGRLHHVVLHQRRIYTCTREAGTSPATASASHFWVVVGKIATPQGTP